MITVLRYLYVIIPIFIVVSVVGQMVVSNQMIVYGTELSAINRRIAEIEEQNVYLRKLLVQQHSIARISEEAKKAGFTEASTYLAFTSDSFPVAIRR